jgi:hypothetical protein
VKSDRNRNRLQVQYCTVGRDTGGQELGMSQPIGMCQQMGPKQQQENRENRGAGEEDNEVD